MEPKPTGIEAPPPRKLRFAPKLKPSRKPKTVVKTEVKVDEDDDSMAQDLLRQFNEGFAKGKPKSERKVAPSQIAFGYGGAATSTKPRRVLNDAHQFPGGSSSGLEKEYKEPWDYYTYYPVTLPLRRPYSGNPALLDEEEFGAAPENVSYDESLANTAQELNLAEESSEPNLLCFQIPPSFPMNKSSSSSSSSSGSGNPNGLPEGYMGKLLVYRSGAMKMKLGDTLYDVSSGSHGIFAQEVVAINTVEKHYTSLGELNKRAILTPDVDAILDSLGGRL